MSRHISFAGVSKTSSAIRPSGQSQTAVRIRKAQAELAELRKLMKPKSAATIRAEQAEAQVVRLRLLLAKQNSQAPSAPAHQQGQRLPRVYHISSSTPKGRNPY